MKNKKTHKLIQAIAAGNKHELNSVYQELTANEVSADNLILSLYFLKDNGRPSGWENRELLSFYPTPTIITEESIQSAKEGLKEYAEHNDYVKLLRGRFEIIMEGMEGYFTLRDNKQLTLLEQYKSAQ